MSGDRFVSELWKQDLLLYMTDHQAEMEFEDDTKNIRISLKVTVKKLWLNLQRLQKYRKYLNYP